MNTEPEKKKNTRWQDEVSALIDKKAAELREMRLKGEEPTSILDPSMQVRVDDILAFARAAMDQPEIRDIFVRRAEIFRKDPDREGLTKEDIEVMSRFQSWYMLKHKAVDNGPAYWMAYALISRVMIGMIESVDSPEARAFLLNSPLSKLMA